MSTRVILYVIAALLAVIASTLLLGQDFTIGAIVILGGTWLVWRVIRYFRDDDFGHQMWKAWIYVRDRAVLHVFIMVMLFVVIGIALGARG